MTSQKIHVSWSGGKDSGIALYRVLKDPRFKVVGLHTVVDKETKKVGLHEIDQHLIQLQADAMGLPIDFLQLEKKPMAYQKLMTSFYNRLADDGVENVLFGDIYLEDLRDFRDTLLKSSALKGIYPIWKKNPYDLMSKFFSSGFESVICAVNTVLIDADWIGKKLSPEFLVEHEHIDPCGENGEYHSFLANAPFYSSPVKINLIGKYEQTHSFKMKNRAGEIEEQRETFGYGNFTAG